jgi:hypothetical protein
MVRDGTGSHRSAIWGGRPRVRITKERGLTGSVVRDLESVWEHLLRGGAIGVCADHTKTWAGYTTFHRERGGTTIWTAGNAFSAWSASAALSSGDELWLESRQPEHIAELLAFSSISSSYDITTTTAIRNTTELVGMVRWRYFYPALRLPDEAMSRPILTSYHGLTWTLDMELEVDMAILAAGFDDYGDTSRSRVGGTVPSPRELNLGDDTQPNRGMRATLDSILDSRKGLRSLTPRTWAT